MVGVERWWGWIPAFAGMSDGGALRSDGGGIVEPTTLQRQLLRQRARARPTRAGDRHGRDDAESVLETCRNGTTD